MEAMPEPDAANPVIPGATTGEGTATFFSPDLVEMMLEDSRLHPTCELSIEGHLNNTRAVHLEILASLEFRRISYGVKDMDPEVQRVINRIQPFADVQRATEVARVKGFTSVNFDLI